MIEKSNRRMTIEIQVWFRQQRTRVVLDAGKAHSRYMDFDIADDLISSENDDNAEYVAAHVIEVLKITRRMRYDEVRVFNL